jgi:flagellar protein FlbD
MIEIHRLAHDDEPLHLNPDLITMIEHTPDTVVTLATGQKVVVSETPDELLGRIRAWRVGILADALASKPPRVRPGDTIHLREA